RKSPHLHEAIAQVLDAQLSEVELAESGRIGDVRAADVHELDMSGRMFAPSQTIADLVGRKCQSGHDRIKERRLAYARLSGEYGKMSLQPLAQLPGSRLLEGACPENLVAESFVDTLYGSGCLG